MAGALAATLPELRVLTLSMNRVTDIGVTPRLLFFFITLKPSVE